MKAKDLDLSDLLDHTATPKRHVAKPRKPKAKEVLKPYIPPPMPQDTTPDAVILYWRHTTCTCGATFEGPRFFPISTFYRVKLPTRAGSMEAWDFIPKFLPAQYPDLPHITDTQTREVTNCARCHGTSTCAPTQSHFQFEPDRETPFYNQKLRPAAYLKPDLTGIPPTTHITPDKEFKADIQEILRGGVTFGTDVAEELFRGLKPHLFPN